MKIKVGNRTFTSDLEAILVILSREELDDLLESVSEGTQTIRYLKYPPEKYNDAQIEQFKILPEELFNKVEKIETEITVEETTEEDTKTEEEDSNLTPKEELGLNNLSNDGEFGENDGDEFLEEDSVE